MNTAPILSWVISHLYAIGWPAVLYGVYRVIRFCIVVARTLTIVEQRVLKGEETIYLMASNHLPHLEMAIQDTNKILGTMHDTMRGTRDDLRVLMVKE